MKRGTNFICEDCTIVFTVYHTRKGKFFCPSCGDHISVRRYSTTKSKRTTEIKWNDEETELVKRCMAGELWTYQVAVMTGRSLDSVRGKIARIKKELNQCEQRQ